MLTGTEDQLWAVLWPDIEEEIRKVFTIYDDIPFSSEVLQKFAKAIARAVADQIIPHIVNNAITKTTVSGFMPGGGSVNDQPGVVE